MFAVSSTPRTANGPDLTLYPPRGFRLARRSSARPPSASCGPPLATQRVYVGSYETSGVSPPPRDPQTPRRTQPSKFHATCTWSLARCPPAAGNSRFVASPTVNMPRVCSYPGARVRNSILHTYRIDAPAIAATAQSRAAADCFLVSGLAFPGSWRRRVAVCLLSAREVPVGMR